MREISDVVKGCLKFVRGVDLSAYENMFMFNSVEEFTEKEEELKEKVLERGDSYATVLIYNVVITPYIKNGEHQYTDKSIPSALFDISDEILREDKLKMVPVSWPWNAKKSFENAKYLGEMNMVGGIAKRIDLTYNAYSEELEIHDIN